MNLVLYKPYNQVCAIIAKVSDSTLEIETPIGEKIFADVTEITYL